MPKAKDMQIQPLKEYAVWCPKCSFVSVSAYASVRMQWYDCPDCGETTSQTEVQQVMVITDEKNDM